MFRRLIKKLFFKQPSGKALVLVSSCVNGGDGSYLFYDEAEQALEHAYHWYGNTDVPFGARMINWATFL